MSNRPQPVTLAVQRVVSTLEGSARVRFTVLFASLVGAAASCPAKADTPREEVVIQASRYPADEQVTEHVQKVLSEDPWIYAEHVTVTTHKGVVRLEGVVSDAAELLRIIRLSRKIPGTRRVDTSDVEINAQLPDGG